MASQEELREVRLEKKKKLEDLGINPYPSKSHRTHSLKEAVDLFDKLKDEEIIISGRIMSQRGQGAILFLDLFDGTDKFQIVLRKDNDIVYLEHEGEDAFTLFKETTDIGDFIEVAGKVFTTNSGQQSLEVFKWRMLSKSILPIPDSFYGLKDDDERYRKRYLDLLLNDETREMFKKKALFWQVIRNYLLEKKFLEVETPTLELTTGGAEARPFTTHHNDFDIDVHLRISVGELWQKRLMAGGFNRTFEIGRVYRNEGSSAEHLQEFTNMEFYAAYMNLEEGKEITKELYKRIALDVFEKTQFETRGHKFDLGGDWDEIDYVEEVKKQTGIDVLESDEKEMKAKLEELGVKFDGENRERMTDSLWKYCRKNISGPAFLVNHPKLVAPLSKKHEDDERKTEMFQVIIAGSEIGRAHAELNDPVDQQKRFDEQKKLLEEGDEEAMMPDTEFVQMMEYGMPPCFGFGFGERLFAFMMDKPVRETQFFPLMRPRD
jgi:lysyl-tRNA synthetase class 2